MAEIWGMAIAGVAAAGATVYASNQQSKAAKSAANAPSYQGKWEKIDNVDYNPAQGYFDFAQIFPELQKKANQMTTYNMRNRERIMPGAGNQMKLASNILQSYMRGEIPQDAAAAINRQIAEQSGGNVNPNTPGMSTTGANFARNIGMTSLDLMNRGLSAAPTWQQLAQSFVVGADVPFAMANQMTANRYRYDALNAGIDQYNASGQAQQFANEYQGAVNQWQGGIMGQQMQAQAAQGYGQAALQLGEMYKNYSNTYNANKAPTTSGWVANATSAGGSAKSYPVPGSSGYNTGIT